jgi:hypothetical protein
MDPKLLEEAQERSAARSKRQIIDDALNGYARRYDVRTSPGYGKATSESIRPCKNPANSGVVSNPPYLVD